MPPRKAAAMDVSNTAHQQALCDAEARLEQSRGAE